MIRNPETGSGTRLLALLLLLWILPWSTASADEPSRPFVWVDDDDYAPFIYRGDDGRPAGIYKDLMIELFGRLGIPLEYDVYPWKRAQKYAEEGKADGMITTMTKERSALFVATDPLFVNSEHVFARRDNPRIEEIMAIRSVPELKGFRVVETIGSGWAEEHFKGLDIIWAPSYTSALNMLASGRVDIYVLGKYPGMADIQNRIRRQVPYSDGLKKIVVGPHALAEIPYSLLIRKDSPFAAMLPRFNQVLQEMKEDGTYQRILESHFHANGMIWQGQ